MRRILPWIFALSCAAAALCFWPRGALYEDASDLLPAGTGRGALALLADAGLLDRVLVTVSVDDASRLAAAVEACGRGLEKSGLFSAVLYRVDGAGAGIARLAAENLPYLMEEDDYRRLAAFTDPAALDRQMARLFVFLNQPEGFAAADIAARDPLGLVPAVLARYARLGAGMDLVLADGIMESRDRRHGLVIAESRHGLTDSAHAARAASVIGRVGRELARLGARMTVTGPLPHTLANRAAVRRDLALLLPLASIALVLLLWFGCASAAGPLLFLIPALAAPPAVVFTAMVCGRLSAIAAGFGIVLLGIGVDFAIHLYFARRDGETASLLRPMSAAAATTIGCFAILLFSAIPVHRQMGVLAIAGLSWCLFLSFILVPTLTRKGQGMGRGLELPRRRARGGGWALALWLVLVAAAAWAWPGIRFSGSMRQMDASGPGVRAAEAEFARVWGSSAAGETVVGAYGDDLAAALDAGGRVAAVLAGAGRGFRSLSLVVPGPELCAQRLARWRAFWSGPGRGLAAGIRRAGEKHGFSPGAFTPFLELVSSPPPFARAGMLAALPAAMRSFFIRRTASGPMIVTTVPGRVDAGLAAALASFPGVRVFSPALWREKVAGEFRRETVAFSLRALVLVAGAALFFLGRPGRVFAALAPVAAALAAMTLAVRLAGGELNFMHVLMGIMVCGLAIDYGLFAVCDRSGRVSRPVGLCAASTLAGFGVFLLASHPALSALGTVTLAGIAAAWPTALLVTPVLAGRRG